MLLTNVRNSRGITHGTLASGLFEVVESPKDGIRLDEGYPDTILRIQCTMRKQCRSADHFPSMSDVETGQSSRSKSESSLRSCRKRLRETVDVTFRTAGINSEGFITTPAEERREMR